MDFNTCFAGTVGLRELALYSHLVPALATMILGVFALWKSPDRRAGGVFFCFTFVFALWLTADLINWTTNNYFLVAATWAPLDYLNLVFFLLLFYFVYRDLSPDKHTWHFPAFLVLAATIPFLITITGNAVFEFNHASCEMAGNAFLSMYKFGAELTVVVATLLLGVTRFVQTWNDPHERTRVALIAGSIFLFMGIFALAEYQSVQTEVYEIMLYTLFVLPIFILMLTLAITSYGTFKLGDAAVKMLFFVFLVLAVTQFFWVGDLTEFLLAAMSFVVILVMGIMLYRSNEREIASRHLLENLNQQQESLLHFISHEVKGFLTEGQNAFAGIVEGDFGEPPEKVKGVAQVALGKMRNGVSTVMDILDASNLKKGTMQYKHAPFDFKQAVTSVVDDLTIAASAKGISIDTKFEDGDCQMEGDDEKLKRHVIRNLIDNSIKYTPQGSILVSLSRTAKAIRFMVKDSGVGITTEDMKHLFTEGGHGKDSIKTNVNSTGYGLFVAKSVVDAHKGKIWAESEGQGKGSTFVVELPLKA